MPRTDPIAHLSRPKLASPALLREVRALGPSALPRLVVLAAAPEEGGDDFAKLNAIRVLADWPGDAATAALLEVFAAASPEERVMEAMVLALALRGPDVLEPLLAYRGTERADLALQTLCMSRSRLAEPDPRVTAWLDERLRAEPARFATHAGVWGDPALLPALHAPIDRILGRLVLDPASMPVLRDLLRAADLCGDRDSWRVKCAVERLEALVADQHAELAQLEATAAARDPLLRR